MTLVRTDPLRDLDRLTEQTLGTLARPAAMPLDAYRSGEDLVLHFDLPGVDPAAVDLSVERNVLTVRAERPGPAAEGADLLVAERPHGAFSRLLILDDTLDTERISARYEAGVLTVTVPAAEEPKPRRVRVGRTAADGGDGGSREAPRSTA
ncbi:Hsp20/alpha crystallin family protein [Streptomyces sp. NPDC051041]|uniref:Hsp20/alpha crystallin family protein n=1 Tax=Streptomyces sp. NPDC051041 TaxID=3365640 RepID=UPI00378CB72D